MRKQVHEYFHNLMWELTKKIEPKFDKGDKEHRSEGMLWDMPDDVLDKNIDEELMDLIVYWAEKKRREDERKADSA